MPLVLDGTNGVSGVDGTASNPAIEGTDSNTGIFYPAADTVAIGTGGTERLRVDSSGNVGVGTSSPTSRLQVWQTGAATSVKIDGIENPIEAARYAANADGSVIFLAKSRNATVGSHTILQNGDQIGVLQARGSNGTSFVDAASIVFAVDGTPGAGNDMPGRIVFNTSPDGTASLTERMRIDSSGNVGIGTTSPESTLHVAKSSSGGKTTVYVDNTAAAAANNAASIKFSVDGGASVSNGGAEIQALINSTVNGSTHLLFSTFDGATLAEHARITSGGDFCVNKTDTTLSVAGLSLGADNTARFTKSASAPLEINRLTNDGTLVLFYQDTVLEGNISVAGTTVSYNGGHLARWSQLLNGQRDESIVKGTVLSNLDEMCEWLDAEGNPLPNEQLNRTKVSDVEGDTNVAGVFVNWDNDDQDNPYDMNIAMTGDMIIRIAQGVTVQKGDLLMSAGDGTAKPQGDDIVRSKTVAKVTSNHVTCTYDDGSYCVPCVLMAC